MPKVMPLCTAAFGALIAFAVEANPPRTIQLVADSDGVSVFFDSEAQAQGVLLRRPETGSVQIEFTEDGRARVHLEPDRSRFPATYPLLTSVSEGWLIHTPALVPDGNELRIDVPPGWSVVPESADRRDGFVYVAPAGAGASPFVDPRVPDDLSVEVRRFIREASEYFGEVVGRTSWEPVWLLSPLPPDAPQAYVGDVALNGVVSVQLAESISLRNLEEVRFMVAHETYHLHAQTYWNEGLLKDWEREGAAEYAAITYFRSILGSTLAQRRLERHLNDCLRDLPDAGLEGSPTQNVRYSCGTLHSWLSMLDARVEQPDLTLFDVLKDGSGRFPDRHHPTAGVALEALRQGDSNVGVLVYEALLASGIPVEMREPPASAWAGAALGPAVLAICSGIDGLSQEADGRWLVHGDDGCSGSGPNTQLLTVGGEDIAGRGKAVFEQVAENCPTGIVFGFRGDTSETSVVYRCEAPPNAIQAIFVLGDVVDHEPGN